jgi:hypothetical protein
MHNSALFAQECAELRTAVEKESQKRRRPKKLIRHEDSLNREEYQNLVHESNAANQLTLDLAGVQNQLPRQRAPPTCSNCNIIGHNRRGCPNRTT